MRRSANWTRLSLNLTINGESGVLTESLDVKSPGWVAKFATRQIHLELYRNFLRLLIKIVKKTLKPLNLPADKTLQFSLQAFLRRGVQQKTADEKFIKPPEKCKITEERGIIMKLEFFKLGLRLFVIIGLLNVGIFAQNNLSAMRWTLTEINGQKPRTNKAYLEISQTEGKFAGNAGCNRMFGTALVNGRNIIFGKIGTTRMLCMRDGLMKLEADFTAALGKVTRFKKTGDNLELYARNRLILRFKGTRKDDSDDNSAVRLEDKKWVLQSIKNRAVPEVEITPFINFDKAKNSAGGNTGCNVFGGNYTANGERILITNLISTMRACVEDERMNVEREFKNSLEKADRFEIVGGKLNLYQNKILLLTFRGENKQR